MNPVTNTERAAAALIYSQFTDQIEQARDNDTLKLGILLDLKKTLMDTGCLAAEAVNLERDLSLASISSGVSCADKARAYIARTELPLTVIGDSARLQSLMESRSSEILSEDGVYAAESKLRKTALAALEGTDQEDKVAAIRIIGRLGGYEEASALTQFLEKVAPGEELTVIEAATRAVFNYAIMTRDKLGEYYAWCVGALERAANVITDPDLAEQTGVLARTINIIDNQDIVPLQRRVDREMACAQIAAAAGEALDNAIKVDPELGRVIREAMEGYVLEEAGAAQSGKRVKA